MKTQWIRLADVFIIGPLMVWGGYALRERNSKAGNTLMAMGAGTVAYNGRNYLRVRKGGVLPGGKADGRKPSDFDPDELQRGTREELEHTANVHVAQEIAMDHLVKDPYYYTKRKGASL